MLDTTAIAEWTRRMLSIRFDARPGAETASRINCAINRDAHAAGQLDESVLRHHSGDVHPERHEVFTFTGTAGRPASVAGRAAH